MMPPAREREPSLALHALGRRCIGNPGRGDTAQVRDGKVDVAAEGGREGRDDGGGFPLHGQRPHPCLRQALRAWAETKC